MIRIRTLAPSELGRIAEIDRSEHVTAEVVVCDGRLEERAVDVQVAAWSREGDGEHSVRGRVAAWQPILDAGGTLLGAFDGPTLAGFAIYRPHLTEDMANLAALFVSRPYRRAGIATQLVGAVVRLARADGARRLYVSATPSVSTVACYRSLGFVRTEAPHPELFALEPEDVHMILPL